MAWSRLVSTELDDEQRLDMAGPFGGLSDVPDYPPGMRICMDEVLLERLGLDQNCEIGDLLDMRCFAVVTSITKNEVNGSAKCRVEMVIQKVATENEMSESTEPGEDDE